MSAPLSPKSDGASEEYGGEARSDALPTNPYQCTRWPKDGTVARPLHFHSDIANEEALSWVAEFCFSFWVYRFQSSCCSRSSGAEGTLHGRAICGGGTASVCGRERIARFRRVLGCHHRRWRGCGRGVTA